MRGLTTKMAWLGRSCFQPSRAPLSWAHRPLPGWGNANKQFAARRCCSGGCDWRWRTARPDTRPFLSLFFHLFSLGCPVVDSLKGAQGALVASGTETRKVAAFTLRNKNSEGGHARGRAQHGQAPSGASASSTPRFRPGSLSLGTGQPKRFFLVRTCPWRPTGRSRRRCLADQRHLPPA